jgi:AraC-like DNA-binding protein
VLPASALVLYVSSVTAGAHVAAWRPTVAGITEVFHARFDDHAYPMHTHDVWALLIVDSGVIRYDLDRHGNDHGATQPVVTLLPPGVAHDGRAATAHGFRKRVLYLDGSVLEPGLAGAAVDGPVLRDAALRQRVAALHDTLAHPGDALAAESRLALIGERLRWHLRGYRGNERPDAAPGLAAALRDLLDERTVAGLSLAEAAATLHAHPTHLVRAFRRAYGLPPHAYLTGRRVEQARALLLAGHPPTEVAVAVGFYDQAHLNRHFRRYLGTAPAAYRLRSRSPGRSPGRLQGEQPLQPGPGGLVAR